MFSSTIKLLAILAVSSMALAKESTKPNNNPACVVVEAVDGARIGLSEDPASNTLYNSFFSTDYEAKQNEGTLFLFRSKGEKAVSKCVFTHPKSPRGEGKCNVVRLGPNDGSKKADFWSCSEI